MKICPKCKNKKPITEFQLRKSGVRAGQRKSFCKKCEKNLLKEWQKNNKDKVATSNRKAHLRNKFGITEEQYASLLEKQNNCCAICEKHASEENRRFAIDHNHFTGEIRGLLCNYCNHRLVGRHRDGDLLRKIADYVDQGTGWFVPKKKRTVKRKPNG